MHTESQILKTLFRILFYSPILIFFLASNIRLPPVHEACPGENQHTGNTSTAAILQVCQPLAQKLGKSALATHCPPYLGLEAVNPHACAFPFHHTPLTKKIGNNNASCKKNNAKNKKNEPLHLKGSFLHLKIKFIYLT